MVKNVGYYLRKQRITLSLAAALDLILDGDQPLEGLFSFVWQSLKAGANSPRHPWRSGVLTTGRWQRNRRLNSRTVVLRDCHFEAKAIDCHTDVRSEKIGDLESCSEVAWLFYDAKSKIQLRVWGKGFVIDGDEADLAWQSTSLASRSAYVTLQPPGTLTAGGQPPSTSDRDVDFVESERGRANFRIVRTEIHELELLYLRASHHVRAFCENVQSSTPEFRWIVP